MRVWIDQDLCTGDGSCTEIAPALFEMDEDGLADVKERTWTDGSASSRPSRPRHLAERVLSTSTPTRS